MYLRKYTFYFILILYLNTRGCPLFKKKLKNNTHGALLCHAVHRFYLGVLNF